MSEQPGVKLWEKLAELEAGRQPHVLVTLTGVDGSAPQDAGARMIVTPDQTVMGTVGGGKVEASAFRQALAMLKEGIPASREIEWNLQRDIGMTCGGQVRFFFEARFLRTWTVAVFGAGHIAQELVRLLLPLPLNLFCADPRQEWTTKLPTAPHLQVTTTDSLASLVAELSDHTQIVAITQGHATDLPVLMQAFQRGCFPFVGCIGSNVKAAKLRGELLAAGISKEAAASLRCPLGLPLGSNAPYEVALSITAQLLQERTTATNLPKKMKPGRSRPAWFGKTR